MDTQAALGVLARLLHCKPSECAAPLRSLLSSLAHMLALSAWVCLESSMTAAGTWTYSCHRVCQLDAPAMLNHLGPVQMRSPTRARRTSGR